MSDAGKQAVPDLVETSCGITRELEKRMRFFTLVSRDRFERQIALRAGSRLACQVRSDAIAENGIVEVAPDD